MYEQMYRSGVAQVIVSGIDLIFAGMLLVGGIALLRQKYIGVRVHRVYVVAKLLVGLVVGTGLLSYLFNTHRWNDETSMDLMGCAYPVMLAVLMGGNTFRRNQPVWGGFGSSAARPRRFTAIGIISISVGGLSLLASMLLIITAAADIRQTITVRNNELQQRQVSTQSSYVYPWNPAERDQEYAREIRNLVIVTAAFGLDLLTAILLLLGGRRLLEADPLGLRTHGIYVIAKLSAVFLCAISLSGLFSSFRFALGSEQLALIIIPLSALYPIVLIFILCEKPFQVRRVEAAN